MYYYPVKISVLCIAEVPDNEARVGAKAANPILPKKSPSTNQKLSKSKCLKVCLCQQGEVLEKCFSVGYMQTYLIF